MEKKGRRAFGGHDNEKGFVYRFECIMSDQNIFLKKVVKQRQTV